MTRKRERRPSGNGQEQHPDTGSQAAAVAPSIHQPVMVAEVARLLAIRPGGRYIDGTVGLGGHAAAILAGSTPGGTLLGIDADPDALVRARERLETFVAEGRVRFAAGNFRAIAAIARREGFERVQGILLDLGVSSLQFSPEGRGFAIRWDQPLDMRMDPALPRSAADIVNKSGEEDLANLFFRYGEERQSRTIARAVVRARPVATTAALARIVKQAVGGATGRGDRRIHPATRVFQALRIAVNEELDALTEALGAAHDLLDAPGGRIAVISYHSLEDRIVKDFFRRESTACLCPPANPVCVCGHQATLTLITRGAVQPSDEEIRGNPRARSARLRVAERNPVPFPPRGDEDTSV